MQSNYTKSHTDNTNEWGTSDGLDGITRKSPRLVFVYANDDGEIYAYLEIDATDDYNRVVSWGAGFELDFNDFNILLEKIRLEFIPYNLYLKYL